METVIVQDFADLLASVQAIEETVYYAAHGIYLCAGIATAFLIAWTVGR